MDPPRRYGRAVAKGSPVWVDDVRSDTKHMGKMMDTDAGKTEESSRSVRLVSRGTNTIPPPAPNRPFTAPAAAPQMLIERIEWDLFITSPLDVSMSLKFVTMHYCNYKRR